MNRIITAIIILVLFAWVVFMAWKSYQVINIIEKTKGIGQMLSQSNFQYSKEGNNFKINL